MWKADSTAKQSSFVRRVCEQYTSFVLGAAVFQNNDGWKDTSLMFESKNLPPDVLI